MSDLESSQGRVSENNEVLDRERFLAVLNDITYAALELQDIDEMYQLLADRLAEIINADGCFLTLWQEDTETTIPAAAYGPLRDTYKKIETGPGEPTITKSVIDAGHTLVIEDAWNSGYAAPHITRQFPSRSMLAIPVQIGAKFLGAALISFDKKHEFSLVEIEYCEQAVRQISLAIANAQTMNALRESEQEYKQLATELKVREEHMEEAQRNAKMGSWEQGAERGTTIWSPGMFSLFNLPVDTRPPSRETLFACVAPSDRDYVRSIIGKAELAEAISPLEFRTVHGKHLFGRIFRDEETSRLSGTLHDVTEQRLLEAQLFQARKMEAVGTLAGGIAHNFNNILTVIMGNYELLSSSIPPESNERRILDQCFTATERAAILTRQLLVVSRKHDLKPETIDVNSLLTDLADLLGPIVGEHINISKDLSPGSLCINADKGHMEQVVMNLMLNARDALQGGGNLTLFSERRDTTEPHIAIVVADDGVGISEENLPHIFDPFFTTKDEGKGTGLGLATVQSIVHQSHGTIELESRYNEGTRVTILLPAAGSDESPASIVQPNLAAQESTGPQSGEATNATVMLVEDHESLRNVATFVLERAGYQVIVCHDAEDAFRHIAEGGSFDLLLTDVQLPGGVSGPEIAEKIASGDNCRPTIFMSGLRDPIPDRDHNYFLPKPFRPNELLVLVERVLAAFE